MTNPCLLGKSSLQKIIDQGAEIGGLVLMSLKENFIFDKRIVKRNIENGKIDREDYLRFLKKLNDASSEAAPFEATLVTMKRKIPTGDLSDEEL